MGSIEIADSTVQAADLRDSLLHRFEEAVYMHSDPDSALELVEKWQPVGRITDTKGRTLVTLTYDETVHLSAIVSDFQSKGILPALSGRMQKLSQQAQSAIAAVLNPAVWVQQEIGSRTDRLSDTWQGSTLRGQTNWLRDYVGDANHTHAKRDGNLTERINWSHKQIEHLDHEIEAIEKGLGMVAAMATPFVARGRRGSVVISMASFASEAGLAIGAGVRVSDSSQLHLSASTTQDFDDLLVRSIFYFEL